MECPSWQYCDVFVFEYFATNFSKMSVSSHKHVSQIYTKLSWEIREKISYLKSLWKIQFNVLK